MIGNAEAALRRDVARLTKHVEILQEQLRRYMPAAPTDDAAPVKSPVSRPAVPDAAETPVQVLHGDRVDRSNAAKALGRSPKTMCDWARLGVGPRPFKVRGRVFYSWAEVQAFAAGEVA